MRTIPQTRSEQLRENVTVLENNARTALASWRGRECTEEEWRRERGRLLEFVTLLRSWEQKALDGKVGLDNAA
jgi:hypothetical protein